MPALRPRELLAGLLDRGVDFIVVGGLAVGFHGWPRATQDIDVCPGPAQENLERLAEALTDLGARPVGTGEFDVDEFPFDPTDPDDLGQGGNFRLQTSYGALDVMQWIPGIPGDLAYRHLDEKAIRASVLGLELRFCSLEDLRAMKRTAGRPRDIDDLAHLPQPG